MFKEIITAIMNAIRGKKKKDDSSPADTSLVNVTAANFEKEVTSADKPVVILFSAEWCPACQKQGPVFSKVAKALSASYKFVKVDVEKAPSVKRRYGVRVIPTLVFYKPGTEDGAATKKEGFHNEEKLKALIASSFAG